MESSIYLPCEHCGAVNRVKTEKLNGGPVCAKCKSHFDLGLPLAVTGAQFDKVVLSSSLPVLVDFWAPWCGPCQSMHPVLEAAARRHQGRVLVVKLNTDEAPEISARYRVQGIPTLILFRDGLEIDRQVGAVPGESIDRLLNLG